MNKKEFIQIADKISTGSASHDEIDQFNRYYNQYQQEYATWDEVSLAEKDAIGLMIKQRIKERIQPRSIPKQIKIWPKLVAAAAILMVLSFGIYFYQFDKESKEDVASLKELDITPGGNKAFLTLANGDEISLTDAENGNIINEAGVIITKTADGQLVYSPEKHTTSFTYNTISTPKGGQYQVLLPDGSSVWLNAQSSLRYPTSFSSLNERKVELNGEAYFEITQNKKKPFIVQTISQDGSGRVQKVEVLGTHFNINNYEDEDITKTTLLEGSVRVSAFGTEVVLKPNQQSHSKKGGLSVVAINPEEVIAWKNGYFMFEDEKIESIMHKIARWYDVEVEFKRKNKEQVFTGTVSKFDNVSKVLNKLELTGGVQFQIKGRRIIVN